MIHILQKAASYWLEKMSPFFTKKQDKTLVEAVRPIPFKLAGLMFLLGDVSRFFLSTLIFQYYKACNIMKTCLLLDPGNLVVRSLLFRWSVFLGTVFFFSLSPTQERRKLLKPVVKKRRNFKKNTLRKGWLRNVYSELQKFAPFMLIFTELQ